MFDRLQAVEDRYERLNELLSDPAIVSDSKKLREYSKEQSDIQEMVEVYREYKDVKQQLADTKEMLDNEKDPDMHDMVKEEFNELNSRIPSLEDRLRILLIPKDPNDDKNVIMEIRGAAGGDEANILQATYSVCIRVMQKHKAGKLILWKLHQIQWAVIKK